MLWLWFHVLLACLLPVLCDVPTPVHVCVVQCTLVVVSCNTCLLACNALCVPFLASWAGSAWEQSLRPKSLRASIASLISRPTVRDLRSHPLRGDPRNQAACAPGLNTADLEERTSIKNQGRSGPFGAACRPIGVWICPTAHQPAPSYG